MTLSEYVVRHGLTQVELARLIGVSKSAVSLYLSGARTPSLRVAERIIKLTKGKVTAGEMLPARGRAA